MTFDELWTIWPTNDRGRKPNKGGALKTYDKVLKVKSVDVQTILEAARLAADWYDRNPNDRKFVPHLQTWLNRDGWVGVEEEFPPERKNLRAELAKIPEASSRQDDLIEAALHWWNENGQAPELFWEYSWRAKHGEPGPDDYRRFDAQIEASRQQPEDTAKPKPFLPRARRLPMSAEEQARLMPGLAEQLAEKEVMPNGNGPEDTSRAVRPERLGDDKSEPPVEGATDVAREPDTSSVGDAPPRERQAADSASHNDLWPI